MTELVNKLGTIILSLWYSHAVSLMLRKLAFANDS